MRASQLQRSLPVVRPETSALEAGRLIGDSSLPGLVVADVKGIPRSVVAAVDVLRLMLPGYILDDLSLAAVFDEQAAEELWGNARTRTVGDLVDDDDVHLARIARVDASDTLVEVAARLADARAAVAWVTDSGSAEPRFVTLPAVLEQILAAAEPGGASARDRRGEPLADAAEDGSAGGADGETREGETGSTAS